MTYRVQVSIPMTSGLPEDVVTNTLYFQRLDAGPATEVDYENMLDHLKSFFEGCYGGGTSYVNTMARYMEPSLTKVKVYDLEDAKPRPALLDVTLNLNLLNRDVSNSTLPSEVAHCISFRSEPVAGVNPASLRGRIYLGGLGNGFIKTNGNNPARLPQSALTEVTTSALGLFNSMLADEWGWVIHSDKLNEDYAVAAIWADDAFDTQRRRGTPATTRTTVNTPEGP